MQEVDASEAEAAEGGSAASGGGGGGSRQVQARALRGEGMSAHDYFMKRPLSPLIKRSVRNQKKLHCFDDMRTEYLRNAIIMLFTRPHGEGICPYCGEIVPLNKHGQLYTWHIQSEECRGKRK